MNRRRLILASAAAMTAGPALAQPDKSAAPPSGEPIVLGQGFTIQPAHVEGPRRLNVFLPATYKPDGPRFPVLYLLDGGVDEDFLHVAGLAQISGAYGVTREFIVVGVESGVQRRHHMTFRSEDPDDLKAIPANGGSGTWRRYLISDVVPWVEAHFHVSDERVLMGESLAGLFVIETLLKQPRAFTGYIAVDPSLWWAKGALARDRALPGWTAQAPRRRVFVAMSSEGPAAEAAHLTEGLGPVADYTYWPMPQETHASVYHPAATQALRQLFKPAPAA